jgi:hypothetical protein
VLLPDGRVLLLGGWSWTGTRAEFTDAVEIFTP